MKITGVRLRPYQITLQRPIGDVNNPTGSNKVTSTAVFIDSDEALSGIAIAQGCGEIVVRMVDELLIGKDPRGVLGHWNTMMSHVFKGGNRGAVTAAIATIDTALWDLKAKINDEPLWKTLGASTRRVRAYASGIDLPLSDTLLQEYYEGLAAKGVSAGKLKIGLDMESDMRRIGIMRDALAKSGKTPELMVDVNEYWSPKQTIRHMHEIEQEFDITWIEEPARRWDAHGLKKVSSSIRAAVASGENLDDVNDFLPLLHHRAIDILNLGPKSSGITGMIKIADLAYAYEVPISLMNAAGSHTAHVAATLPNHVAMEYLGAGRDDIFVETHEIKDGWIELTDRPGIGLTFDEKKLTEFAIAQDLGSLAWGRRHGAGLYVWGTGQNLPETE